MTDKIVTFTTEGKLVALLASYIRGVRPVLDASKCIIDLTSNLSILADQDPIEITQRWATARGETIDTADLKRN